MWRSLPICFLLMVLLPRAAGATDAASDGERLRKAGRYADAQKLLEPAVLRDPHGLAARLTRARL